MNVNLETLLSRSKNNMAEGTKQKVYDNALKMIERAYNEGIYAQITEGYRSNQRQNELYAQGRSKPGDIVTNAKAGQSNHNYGIAVDFVLVSDDGSTALWEVNDEWKRVAEIGMSLGFKWGGNWPNFKDYPHLEMPELKNQKSKGGNRVVQKLSVDGYRGQKTIDRWQQFMGTPRDGFISKPSTLIEAWQQFLNDYGCAYIAVDGYEGENTIKATQSFLGTPVDGYISKPSTMIKQLQTFLNEYGR